MFTAYIMLGDYASEIAAKFSKWNVILGIILMLIAMIAVFCIKPIVSKLNLSEEKRDKVVLAVRIVAIVVAFGAALAVCF